MQPSSGAGQQQLLLYVLILASVTWAVYRRTRRQPVHPVRAAVTAGIIVLLTAVGLAKSWSGHPLAFELAPLALAAGLVLGWLLMATIHFWRDETTGRLWMQGGLLYLAIWLATFALRFGVGYAAGEYSSGAEASRGLPPAGPLGTLSIDLLFLSLGLWIARAAALVHRYRSFELATADQPG